VFAGRSLSWPKIGLPANWAYTGGMSENVDLQLVLKRVDTVLSRQDGILAELATLNETVRAMARSQVTMQRDIATLKDRVVILTAAIDEHPPAHV
jgi:hypothetical protein